MAIATIRIVKGAKIEEIVKNEAEDTSPHRLKDGMGKLILDENGTAYVIRRMARIVVSEVKTSQQLYNFLNELAKYKEQIQEIHRKK